jgi:hypothetical protein
VKRNLMVACAAAAVLAACGPKELSYKRDVQPILAANCYECHSAGKPGTAATGFDMTTYEGLMKGGKFGPFVRPGDPLSSTLNMVVEGRTDPSIRMPHNGKKLADRDIETLRTWVAQGAKNN